ncbi:MAG: Protein translocase subunit SecE [Chthonomonadaceae bacterium]|jgi:preprotein translocase subunit SecE|nr:Protein translocase subunit SecE [Chthonomonadaceae bacterium]
MAVEQRPNPGGPVGPTGAESLQRTTNFLQETIVELKKTTWPSKKEAWRLTAVVIGVITALGIYMGTLDFLLTKLVDHFSILPK